MTHEIILEEGCYYHIYNRGINGANIFFEERNYNYFLQKYAFYMGEVVDTYAYCLLKNHFHLLIRVKSNLSGLQDLTGLNDSLTEVNKKGLHNPEMIVSKRFSDFFNSYSKSINKAQLRTGALFETPFKRILVSDSEYFTRLVWYIHSNAQKHGLVTNFKDYPHSSYHSLLSVKSTRLAREEVMEWFCNRKTYIDFHNSMLPESVLSHLLIEFD